MYAIPPVIRFTEVYNNIGLMTVHIVFTLDCICLVA